MKELLAMIGAAVVAVFGMGLTAIAADGYIESDGTQAVNTGYYINSRTKIEIDFQMTEITSQARLFGQTDTDYGNYTVVYFGDSASNFKFGYGNTFNGVYIAPNNLQRNTIIYDGPNNKGYLLQNGEQVSSVDLTAAHDASANFPMAIFGECVNATGTSFNNRAKMRLYGFKVYEDGVVVHDYVPALKGGTVGLHDAKTGAFLYDTRYSGYGTFAYGGDIMELPDDGYVESDGTVGVNSRYFFNPKSRIEVDYALTDVATQQQRIYGRDAAGPASSFYVQGSLNVAFGCGDTFSNDGLQTGLKADTRRHTAILDVNEKKAALITGTTTNWFNNFPVARVPTTTSMIPVGIFARLLESTSGMAYDSWAKVKIYRIAFYTDGSKEHDYVPCVQGGIVGLKDRVDGAFITSETAGDLTYGGNILVEKGPAYIDNNGKATFDTGYTPTPHTRVEIDYLHVNNLKDNRVFSAYASDKLYYMHYSNSATNYAWCCMDNAGNWTSTGLAINKFRRRTFILDPHTDFTGLVTAGYTNYSSTVSGPVAAKGGTYVKPDAGVPIKVCSDATGLLVSDMRLYGLRIYEAGALVRDYVPSVQNGEAGLYDQVNHTFKGSASRYPFTIGGDFTTDGKDDAYLESDGTQGINTEYRAKGSLSRIEADFAFIDTAMVDNNYQQRVFGVDTDGKLNYTLYINGSGQFVFAFGNTFINTHGPFVTADTARHTAVIDGYHDRLYFITGGVTNNTYDVSGDAHNNNGVFPMGIFAIPTVQAATSWYNPSKIKLYSLRIYEQDVLKHEYIPYKKGATVGLYDTVEKIVKTDARNSATPFKVGGKGVDGEEKWIVVPQGAVLREGDAARVISANASGAQFYKWTKNGEAIEGGADGDLTVEWARGGATDTYAVTPVYSVYGVETEGAAMSVTVENIPQGTMIIVL